MADVDEELHERVREIVRTIPEGTVASYGDIAARAGAPSPRLVGRILAEDGQDIPWHRVLRTSGYPAPHIAREQLARLRAEGVLADGERIPMRRYRWTD
ncbi:MGMT family protein [Sciscionella sediminilitoris]|uniref:MGMT family protein n=1 Tax=Sciscionella sediminilitoris TaxID=1445613 RepID=UPI0004DF26A3|nr:MGMT family protein [Sciscionella sp. SE31]